MKKNNLGSKKVLRPKPALP